MPRGKKKSKSIAAKGKQGGPTETPANSAKFSLSKIPKILKAGAQESYLLTLRLGDDFTVVSDGSGLVQTVQSCTPIGCGNWSSFVATFDEYRVLAVVFDFEPITAVGGSTVTFYAPIAHVFDRDSVGPQTSYTLASRYSSWGEAPGQCRFHKVISMESIEESTFVGTGTTKTLGWLQLYSSGNVTSTGLGRMKMQVIVQFRGFGI